MIEARATVTALDGDYAIVAVENQSGCGRCHEPGGCGGHNLVHMVCRSSREFRVLNPVSARVGEAVAIAVPDGAVSRSALWIYGIPLALVFTGAVTAKELFGGDAAAIGGAVLGLLLSWGLVARRRRAMAADVRLQPTILSRV